MFAALVLPPLAACGGGGGSTSTVPQVDGATLLSQSLNDLAHESSYHSVLTASGSFATNLNDGAVDVRWSSSGGIGIGTMTFTSMSHHVSADLVVSDQTIYVRGSEAITALFGTQTSTDYGTHWVSLPWGPNTIPLLGGATDPKLIKGCVTGLLGPNPVVTGAGQVGGVDVFTLDAGAGGQSGITTKVEIAQASPHRLAHVEAQSGFSPLTANCIGLTDNSGSTNSLNLDLTSFGQPLNVNPPTDVIPVLQ